MTYKEIRKNKEINAYIKKGNDNLRTPSLRTNYRNKSYIELNTTPKKVLERYINNQYFGKFLPIN